jgi:hypothetical protein
MWLDFNFEVATDLFLLPLLGVSGLMQTWGMLDWRVGCPNLKWYYDSWVSGFWTRQIQLREHRLFSGNILGKGLWWTPASGISMYRWPVAANPVFTGTVYAGVVAAMVTQDNGISFTHSHTFIITCHVLLRLADVVTSTWVVSWLIPS